MSVFLLIVSYLAGAIFTAIAARTLHSLDSRDSLLLILLGPACSIGVLIDVVYGAYTTIKFRYFS